MITRRTILAAAALSALPLRASADPMVSFSQAVFEEAQAEGRSILVHVTAPWCGTCRVQKQVLPEVLAAPDLSHILWLNVDYASQGDLLRQFKVRHWSTLILFKGNEELHRAVGVTNPGQLRTFLEVAVG